MKIDYFEDIIAFGIYAQGVDASLDLQALLPSFGMAKSKIEKIIGESVYKEVRDGDHPDLQELIKSALANYCMYEYVPFSNLKKDRESQMYKYQLDMSREQYLSCAWVAMDDVLLKLDSSDMTLWKDTEIFKERKNLIVTSARDFNFYFDINSSSLFYYKTLYLQREIITENLIPRLGKELLCKHPQLIELVKRLICYNVMSRAIQTFEVAELPANIRAKLSNEYSKDNSFELQREKLYQALMDKVNQYYSNLDKILSSNKGTGGIKNINKESNKFYIS